MLREVLEQSLATSSSQQDEGLRVKIGDTLGRQTFRIWSLAGVLGSFSAHINGPKSMLEVYTNSIDHAVLFQQYDGTRSKVAAGELS